ncbi:MAG TPA: hypothetical protein VH477_16850 [Bryobacteraceae bacterium]
MRGRQTFRICVAYALAVNLSFAATPTIGIASAIGTFIVNSNEVDGNANLFEGSKVKTGKASSQVLLQNGASLTLGLNSAGMVYRDHLLLESGATKVDNMSGYRVEAGSYRIEQDQPASQAVVRLEAGMVEIGALAGSLRVLDSKGALLTRIGTGTASAFQAGGSGGGQGTPNPNVNTRTRYRTAAALLLAATLAGLGLAVDAILQPAPTSP